MWKYAIAAGKALRPPVTLLLDCPWAREPAPVGWTYGKTVWTGGDGALKVPDDVRVVVLFDHSGDTGASGSHVADGPLLRDLIASHGVIFIGLTQAGISHRFANLLSEAMTLQPSDHHQPASSVTIQESPFKPFLSRHSHKFSSAPEVTVADADTLAAHTRTSRTVAVMKRLGTGLVVVMPDMGPPESFLSELIEIATGLIEHPAEVWIDQPRYLDARDRPAQRPENRHRH